MKPAGFVRLSDSHVPPLAEFAPMMKKIKSLLGRMAARQHVGAVASALRQALARCSDPIPTLLVCFQNGAYVRNMVGQLNAFGLRPIVLDNCSKDASTIAILQSLESSGAAQVVRCGHNFGHLVGFQDEVYEVLPPVFAYSDPDLQLSPDLPRDFLQVLAELTTRYSVYKAGLALDLMPDQDIIPSTLRRSKKRPFSFRATYGVREWEARYWRLRLADESLEMYAGGIDTTLAVYRKANFAGNFHDGIRVAGPFRAIHLPWFPALDLLTAKERDTYLRGNRSSAWVK
jgi:hypothetical protein